MKVWGAQAPDELLEQGRDRVNATWGIALLGCGFALQAAGYWLALAGGSERDHGAGLAAVAIAVALASCAGALAVWRAFRGRHLRRFLVRLACEDPMNDKTWAMPQVGMLVAWGQQLKYVRRGHHEGRVFVQETPAAFVLRVFGVEETRTGELPISWTGEHEITD